MELSIQRIEEIYQEKLNLLKELVTCLSLERDSLINLDIGKLWALMEEKQKILESIDIKAKQVRDIIEESYPDREIPVKDHRRIRGLSQKIADLKEEIKTRVRENVSFIQDSLGFINEMISVLVTGGRPAFSYDPVVKNKKKMSSIIYYKEV